MTEIQFHQRPPAAGSPFRVPSDHVVVTRGQRTSSPDGTVLLPGHLVIPLVDGIGRGSIEPTAPGEHVLVTYHHRESYSKRFEIPDSSSLVDDTALIEIH